MAMFMGTPLDRRARAILMCRLLADRAEDLEVPMQSLGEIAREIAQCLMDESGDDSSAVRPAKLRVIEGGRR
jgi:hypothetical protein